MKEGMPVAVRAAAPQIRMTISSGERMSSPSMRDSTPRTLSLGEFKPSISSAPQVNETSRVGTGTLFRDTVPFVVPGLESLPTQTEKIPSLPRIDMTRPTDIFVPSVRRAPEKKAKAFEPVATPVIEESKAPEKTAPPVINENSKAPVHVMPEAIHVSTPLRTPEQIARWRETIKPKIEKTLPQAKPVEIISPDTDTEIVRHVREELSEEEVQKLLKEKGVPETKAILAQTGQTVTKELIRAALVGIDTKATNAKTGVKAKEASQSEKKAHQALQPEVKPQVDVEPKPKMEQPPMPLKQDSDEKVFTRDEKAENARRLTLAGGFVKLVAGIFKFETDIKTEHSGEDLVAELPSTPSPKVLSGLAHLFGIPDGSWIAFVEKLRAIPPTSAFPLLVQANAVIDKTRPVDIKPKKEANKLARPDEVALVLSGASQKELVNAS